MSSTADRYCTQCGTVALPKNTIKGSFFVELLLWCCLFIPGLLYTLWRLSTKAQVCPACGAPNMIPVDSPIARKALQQP